ncbi:hypothetical protein [Ruegeria atlantica]|uniref:hypothetical protein n=1 Tax=Ruegeria atlantica TaxID=81569 RepID=UPI00147E78B2|nr:hypothetical protein [Ruegeria atlantica]
MSTNGLQPGELSLADLIQAMKPTQLWGSIVSFAAVVCGAWYFGYWVKDQQAAFDYRELNGQISEVNAELESLAKVSEAQSKEIKFLSKKNRLLSLLVLFSEEDARRLELLDKIENGSTDDKTELDFVESQKKWRAIGNNLLEFVEALDTEGGAGSSSDVTMRLGKGISGQTITFVEDGSVWPLPDILFAAAD